MTNTVKTEFLIPCIYTPNYFNGRLLTAEDLKKEKEGNQQRQHYLGQALGEGVAYGLEVSASTLPNKVTVKAGLAINRLGQVLRLHEDTNVALVREEEKEAEDAALFSPCEKIITTNHLSGSGIYVLTIAPASGFKGMAPSSSLNVEITGGSACGSRDVVEGVQFRLGKMDLDKLLRNNTTVLSKINHLIYKNDFQSISKLRNLIAHLCFGTLSVNSFSKYGAIYDLTEKDLQKDIQKDCYVPLSIIYWTDKGIQFMDMWSVRRWITKNPLSYSWNELTGNYRKSAGWAIFMQFQEQIESIYEKVVNSYDITQLKVTDFLCYLPPAGFILASDRVSLNEFKYQKLFEECTYREPIFIEGARVESLLRHSIAYPPIDLEDKVMLWLYMVRENREQSENSRQIQQPYIIFASGHIPFYGEPKYDVSRWDYSNYV